MLRSYMLRCWCRCALLRPSLLRFLRYRSALLGWRNVRLLPTCRWQWMLRSHVIRLLRRNLSTVLRSIWRGLLLRPNLVRPLLLGSLLVVARLLATGRRWRALTLLRRALTLTLFDRLPILFQNRPLYGTGAFDLLRNRCLANNVANRLGSKCCAGRSRNDIYLWTFVNDDSTARAIKVAIDAPDVVNHPSAIDDRRVIHDDRVGTDRLAEMMNIHEDEQ